MLLHRDLLHGGFEESPERLTNIYTSLKQLELWQRCLEVKGRLATDEELTLVHSKDFIRQLKKTSTMEDEALAAYQSTFKSVYLCRETFEAASCAVGSLLSIVDCVLSGQSQSGVAVIRPPGHHAEKNLMMGFCVFNNIAIATKYAQEKYGLKRILIVDWDIHHGNGIQTSFYEDCRALYLSLHRFDSGSFYPFGGSGYVNRVGSGAGIGYNVNIPWNDEYKGDAEYIAAFQHVVLPIAYEYCPELVLVAAGFDAALNDPMGKYRLTSAVFGHMTQMLKGLANGRVVLALEGGYDLVSTSESMASCVSVLLGDPCPPLPAMVPSTSGVRSIRCVIDTHKKYWKSLQYGVDLPSDEQLLKIRHEKEKLASS